MAINTSDATHFVKKQICLNGFFSISELNYVDSITLITLLTECGFQFTLQAHCLLFYFRSPAVLKAGNVMLSPFFQMLRKSST